MRVGASSAAAVLGAWLVMATFASIARADATIGFDNLAPGTSVTNQYAGQGVTFSGAIVPPVVRQAADVAQSPPNVATIDTVCDVDHPIGGDLTASFTSHHAQVSAYVGDVSGNAYPNSNVTLTGFDSTGTVVTSYTTGMLQGGVHNLLSISDTSARIASVEISQAPGLSACSAAVDDFSFSDTAGPPPPADFAVSAQCPPACPGVSLQAGNSLNVPVQITRNQQSSGPIALAASGLPPGVTAQFTPNPVAGGGTNQVTLTLSAAPSAPAASNVPATITGTPQSGSAGTAARSTSLAVTVAPGYDLRVQGIEVNQGVQLSNAATRIPQFNPLSTLGDLPGESGAGAPFQTLTYDYVGVPLVKDRRTVVTVYGTVSGLAFGQSLSGVTASLTVARNGVTLGTLAPENLNTAVPAAGDGVSLGTRINRTGGFVFALPPDWAEGTLTLTAQLMAPPPPLTGGGIGECGGCQANDTMSLQNIRFAPLYPAIIVPVLVTDCNPFTIDDDNPDFYQMVLRHAFDVTPVPLSFTIAYGGTLDGCADSTYEADPSKFAQEFPLICSPSNAAKCVRAFVESDLHGRLDDMQGAVDHPPSSFFTGIENFDAGITYTPNNRTRFDNDSVAIVNWNRPLTSVAHEIGHLLFRPHASGCNGGDAGGSFESWPPDGMGLIQGVGVDQLDGDTVLASGGKSVGTACGGIGQTQCTAPDGVYDYMSYCAPTNYTYPNVEPNTWISPQGWQELIFSWESGRPGSINDPAEPARAGPVARASAAVRSPQLVVDAFSLGGHAIIAGLHATTSSSGRGGDSAYTLLARNAAGHIDARATMAAVTVHDDQGQGMPALVFQSLSGRLPASARTASIELDYHGRLQDRLRRPVHEPAVRLLSPLRGRIGKSRFVVVRWTPSISLRSRSDPRTRLNATIVYSAHGGRRYRVVFSGPSTGRAKLPSILFGRSKNARIQVIVSDGFSERTATSHRLTVVGSPPHPHIIGAPTPGAVASGGSVSFQGTAEDDQGRALPPAALSWYLGDRLLGRGPTLDNVELPPGHDRVTLAARDQIGRTGLTSVRVDVVASAPFLTELVVPARISSSSRILPVTIATRGPVVLAIGRERWRVGPVARTLTVKVSPGRTPLRLSLKLTTAGSTRTAMLVLQVARY